MYGDEHPTQRALREARELTIEGLSTAFARDELSMDEFERRVDAAFATAAVPELEDLLSDLNPGLGLVVEPGKAGQPIVQANDLARPRVAIVAQPTQTIPRALALFGNVERRGRMQVAPKSQVISVFGNVELDLRDADWLSQTSELEVRVVFGNAEITVPPNLSVVCEGTGIFGSFASVHRVPMGEASGPCLRITGSAVFGNFEIRTMPRGFARRDYKQLGRR